MKQSKSLFDLCQITQGMRSGKTISIMAMAYLRNNADNEQYMENRLLQNSEYILLRGKANGKYGGLLREVNVTSTMEISKQAIMELCNSMPKEYRKKAVFMMNFVTLNEVRRALGTDSRELLSGGGDNDLKLLEKPIMLCNAMPFAKVGNVPILYGDFSKVRIEDCGRSSVEQVPYNGTADDLQCSMTGYMNCVLTDRQAVWGIKVI